MPTKTTKTIKKTCKKPCCAKAKAAPKTPALKRFAFIGMGIQARDLLKQFLPANIVITATCDCDRIRREDGAKRVNDFYAASEDKKQYAGICKAVADFRDVIADKNIDAVVIVTPDHWHAYMCVEAMKAGKDVYCEKPLTYSVEESVLVMQAAKKYKSVFQTGSWQRSRYEFRTAAMIVRNGLIGDVKYVDCNYGQGTDAPLLGGPSQPHRFFSDLQNAEEEGAPNPDCDWDMWLGPAPYSPYSDQCAPRGVNTFYPMFWRFDDYFATGYNGDWGAHHLDIAQWALDYDKTGPVKIIRSDAPHSKNPIHGCRRQQDMKFVFADGTVIEHKPFAHWGTIFYGTKGIVAVNRGKIAVWKGKGVKPSAKVREELNNDTFKGMKKVGSFFGKDWGSSTDIQAGAGLVETLDAINEYFKLDKAPIQLYKSTSQVGNFIDCCYSRKMTISPAETGARASILCQLCNISYVYDVGFDWDPKRNTFAKGSGDPLWLRRPVYRNGWDIKL